MISQLFANIASQIHFTDTSSGQVSDVSNWPEGYIRKVDRFSVKYEGLIRIDTVDDCTVYLSSDDGLCLAIDGSQVIDNGGLHSAQMKQGTVHHLPGYHPITVTIYENTGQAVARLEYSSPALSRQYVTDAWHM
ncbi:MAG: PA14 domain-containing protein [Methanomicrobiales archaeon]